MLPSPSTTSTVDGYEVSVHTVADNRGEVAFALTVRLDGALVTDLQPYLGAAGHLIGIHAGDLAYAHVHPNGYEHGTVTFDAELPSEGRYGLFFDSSTTTWCAPLRSRSTGPRQWQHDDGALGATHHDDRPRPDVHHNRHTCRQRHDVRRLCGSDHETTQQLDGVEASVNYAIEQATVTMTRVRLLWSDGAS